MLLSFKGGVDTGNKSEFLNGSDIQFLAPAGTLSIPVPDGCTPIVSKGEAVLRGQPIAVTADNNGAWLSSPASGTVTAVNTRIVIDSDGKTAPYAAKLDTADPYDFLTQAGVCDRHGTPTAQKLSDSPSEFIINCVEDQPYFVNVQAILAVCTDDFCAGIEILKKLFENIRITICVTQEIFSLSKPVSEKYSDDGNIVIQTVCSKYPQADHGVLKRTVADTERAVVLDAEELYSIGKAFRTGRSITEKMVTLSGDCAKRSEVFLVPYGTPVSTLLRAGSGFKREPLKVIKGSVMNGLAIYNLRTPIDRTTSSVLTLFDHQHRYAAESHCIGCSRCVRVCPEGLSPRHIIDAYRHNDIASIKKSGVSHCNLCSACSFICPSRVNLPLILKAAKLMGE